LARKGRGEKLRERKKREKKKREAKTDNLLERGGGKKKKESERIAPFDHREKKKGKKRGRLLSCVSRKEKEKKKKIFQTLWGRRGVGTEECRKKKWIKTLPFSDCLQGKKEDRSFRIKGEGKYKVGKKGRGKEEDIYSIPFPRKRGKRRKKKKKSPLCGEPLQEKAGT